jgi:hypothetical protein
VAYAPPPDGSRLGFHLLQPAWIREQAGYSLDPVKLQDTILTTQSRHTTGATPKLADSIIFDQIVESRLGSIVLGHAHTPLSLLLKVTRTVQHLTGVGHIEDALLFTSHPGLRVNVSIIHIAQIDAPAVLL